jgi:hypothetical protein
MWRLATTFILLSSLTAMAQFPAEIPDECRPLAKREKFSPIIQNKYDAARAKVRLFRMRDDELVAPCREAVLRLEAMMRQ